MTNKPVINVKLACNVRLFIAGVFCSTEIGSGTKENLQNNVASHEMIQNTNMHRQPLQQLQPIMSSRFDSNAGEQPAQAPIVPLPSLSTRPSSVHYTNQAFPLSSSSRPQSCSFTSKYHFLSDKRENEKSRATLDDQALERHVRVFQGIRSLDGSGHPFLCFHSKNRLRASAIRLLIPLAQDSCKNISHMYNLTYA